MSTHLPGFIVLALASKAAASPGHTPVANLLPLVAASVTLSPRYLPGYTLWKKMFILALAHSFQGFRKVWRAAQIKVAGAHGRPSHPDRSGSRGRNAKPRAK